MVLRAGLVALRRLWFTSVNGYGLLRAGKETETEYRGNGETETGRGLKSEV